MSSERFSDAELDTVAAAVRRLYEDGATPTQLLLCISEQLGQPCDSLEFPIVMIMRRAFGLGLGLARDALHSPLLRHKVLQTNEEFDALFRSYIDARNKHWPPLGEHNNRTS